MPILKNIFKGCFTIIVSFFTIIIIILILYFFSTVSKIKNSNKLVDEKWTEIYDLSSERLLVIRDFVELQKNYGSNFIELQKEISFDIANRKVYSNLCDMQFVLQEYKLDSCYMQILKDTPQFSKESLFYTNKVDSIDVIVNSTIFDYNNLVQHHNSSVMTILSRLIARHLGVVKKEYFSIKYGEVNKNPIIEKQIFFERLNKVDSIFQSKNK